MKVPSCVLFILVVLAVSFPVPIYEEKKFKYTKFDIEVEDNFNYIKGDKEFIKEKIEEEKKYGDYKIDKNLIKIIEKEQSNYFSGLYEKEDVFKVGDYTYYKKIEGETTVWYRKLKNKGNEQLILDERYIEKNSNYVKVKRILPSFDGSKLAYLVDTVGNEKYTLRVKEIGGGMIYSYCCVSDDIFWLDSNKLIFTVIEDYEAQPVSAVVADISTKKENRIFHTDETSYKISIYPTSDYKFFIINCYNADGNEVYYIKADLKKISEEDAVKMFDFQQNNFYEIDHHKNHFYVKHQTDAINFKLSEYSEDLKTSWTIQHGTKYVMIDKIACQRGKLIVFQHLVRKFEQQIVLYDLSIRPFKKTILDLVKDFSKNQTLFYSYGYSTKSQFISKNPYFDETEGFYFIAESPVFPPQRVYYNYEKKTYTEVYVPVIPGFLPEDYQLDQEMIVSLYENDTTIPVTVAYRSYHYRDRRPMHVEIYSAFGDIYWPKFNAEFLPLLERGIVVIIVNARGSAGKGMQWYYDGKKEKKDNTWKDLESVLDHYINIMDFTEGNLVSVRGFGAGAIPVAQVINHNPDLIGVAILDDPLLDVLEYMVDVENPLDDFYGKEFGNPNENIDNFKFMLNSYPYHNISKKEKPLPHILFEVGVNGNRFKEDFIIKYLAKLRVNKKKDKKKDYRYTVANFFDGGSIGAGDRNGIKVSSRTISFIIKNTIGYYWYDPLQWVWVTIMILANFMILATFNLTFLCREYRIGKKIEKIGENKENVQIQNPETDKIQVDSEESEEEQEVQGEDIEEKE